VALTAPALSGDQPPDNAMLGRVRRAITHFTFQPVDDGGPIHINLEGAARERGIALTAEDLIDMREASHIRTREDCQ
jgi:hypothetical protein